MWLPHRPSRASLLQRNGLCAVQILVLATLFLAPSLTSAQGFQQGFDFRSTASFVTDPPGDTYVLAGTAYPTKVNGVTFGWVNTSLVQSRNRSTSVDPRLAGINFATNGSPATFYVDVPASGTYNLALALGDAGWQECWVGCQVQFLDGSTVLATVTTGSMNLGFFDDAQGNVWSAAAWPTNNVSQQVTLTGTRLTVVVGTNIASGDYTPIAFLGVYQVTPPTFAISASPASLNVQQGNQGTSTITTTIGGGFNSAIALSASGVPSGTTVSFNPNPIPAPGAGNSTMTITVGSSTPVGTYPITVTGSGGGIQQNTTVMLTVFAANAWQIGFDFRNTSTFVTDPPGDTYVLSTMAYPSNGDGVTFGWANTSLVQGRDRSTSVDPRLAGINFATNGSPATFYVNLPSAGTYNLALAMGDAGWPECTVECEVQFLDGSTVLATVTGGPTNMGYFYDAKGKNWSAAQWPGSNLSQQVTLAGTQLTMVVGTSKATGDFTTVAFLGVAQVSGGSPNYAISASPASLSVQQGNQGTSTITTTVSGGFNSAITLSAAGMPSGTTVSFNPNPIPAPGSGNSTMTITVGSSTPAGTYPITVTGNGGGIQQNTTVMLTVAAVAGWQQGFDFRNTSTFVTDSPGDSYVLPTTVYPTRVNGVTFGWLKANSTQGRDRSKSVDPRLAGINFVTNGSPAMFYVDLPSAGTYNLSLALGDDGWQECLVQCQIQFQDGNTVLATVTGGPINAGYFYDAQGDKWSAAAWPGNNLSLQVTLSGTRLTMTVGTNHSTGDFTTLAFMGITQP
jgi:hypothetical protein